MKICIISVSKNDYAPQRILKEGKKIGHEMYLTTWLDLYVQLDESGIYFGDKNRSLDYFDAIIPRSPHFKAKVGSKIITKRLNTLLKLLIEYAKEKKIALLNSAFFSQYQSLDKFAQQYFLFKNNFSGISSLHFSALSKIKNEKKLSFPIIAKLAQGSLGTGVFKIKNELELKKFIAKNDTYGKFYLLQKYLPIDCDFRVLVINKRAVGVMKRVPKKGEWRTNVSQGGTACKTEPHETKKISRLAENVAKKMSLDYVGVDILNHNGKLHVIEVNSLAQFRGFEKAYPRANVGKAIIKLMEHKAKKTTRNT